MPSRLTARLLAVLCTTGLASPLAAQEGPTAMEIIDAWAASPHADPTAEAFRHWDAEAELRAVPESCAQCHSGVGFLDYIGADGSEAGVVNAPAPLGGLIGCETCHNDAAMSLQTVTFPSGEIVGDLGNSAMCAVCHQGRTSTDSVREAVAGAEDDVVQGDLTFLNIHYRAAAATLMGGLVRGGYQYEGHDYAGRFEHPAPANTCTGCHSPHSLEVAVDSCATCHQGVDDPRAIRMTQADIDGDGDTSEGLASVIDSLHGRLDEAIRAYAAEVVGAPIVYASESYPYFFADTDADGTAGEDEAAYPNRYQSWTPRLLKAAYNYQFVAKDPGGYAHNPHYTLQLLIDSLDSLAERVEVDTAGLVRP